MDSRASARSCVEGILYRRIRLLLLLIILLSVLAYYYRSELGAGFGYARSRMMPDTSAAGSRNAAYIIPWAKVKLIPFESGFELPVYLTNAGDGSGRIFVVEKEGRIKVIKDGETLEEPFLDIVHRVRSKDERVRSCERRLPSPLQGERQVLRKLYGPRRRYNRIGI